jgi:aspartyl protease family protein
MGAVGWGWITAVVAWAVAVVAKEPIAGLAPAEVAAALGLAAIALMLTGWATERARGSWRGAVGAVAVWAVLVGGLGAAYLHRGNLLDAARAMREEMGIGLPEASVGQGGEVAVTRRFDGTFLIPAKVNDRDVPFLFDTGASSVVLSAETAQALGLRPETLNYRIPVSTANGRGLAAPVTIDRLSVGPIEMRRMSALVARPGMLEGNLLGQTFLERLESYEVRGKRLVLRATKS